MGQVSELMRSGLIGALPFAPTRSAGDVLSLLEHSRQTRARPLSELHETLGEALELSIPKTLQEVLAGSLGVDANAVIDDGVDAVDTDVADTETAPPTPSIRLDFPALPPLPTLLADLAKMTSPLPAKQPEGVHE